MAKLLWAQDVLYYITLIFTPQNFGPIAHKLKIAQLLFLHFLQNCPTSTTHNLVIFHHIDAILDFLESSRCPLHPLCWKFFHLELLSWCKLPWQKVSFCWLLKGPVMYEPISSKWSIFDLDLWETKLYRIEFPSNWALVEEFLIKYEKFMLGQSSVDFSLRKP